MIIPDSSAACLTKQQLTRTLGTNLNDSDLAFCLENIEIQQRE